jgi:hypothetical protein
MKLSTMKCSALAWVLCGGIAFAQAPHSKSHLSGTQKAAHPDVAQAAAGFCYGTSGCPCNNNDTIAGFGCLNSSSAFFQHGGELLSSGNPKVSADTLVLTAKSTVPLQLGIYFQGTLSVSGSGIKFGDGVRCVAGAAIRLTMQTAAHDGTSEYGAPLGDVPISVRGHVPASGGTRYYQVWYHDDHGVCAANSSNYTNALSVVWMP